MIIASLFLFLTLHFSFFFLNKPPRLSFLREPNFTPSPSELFEKPLETDISSAMSRYPIPPCAALPLSFFHYPNGIQHSCIFKKSRGTCLLEVLLLCVCAAYSCECCSYLFVKRRRNYVNGQRAVMTRLYALFFWVTQGTHRMVSSTSQLPMLMNVETGQQHPFKVGSCMSDHPDLVPVTKCG